METSQKHNYATFLSLCGGRSHMLIEVINELIILVQHSVLHVFAISMLSESKLSSDVAP